MKSTLGVNFINVICAAFTCADPESIKFFDNLTIILMHLGSAHVKAAHKMLMKLTPEFVKMKFYVKVILILKVLVNSKIL